MWNARTRDQRPPRASPLPRHPLREVGLCPGLPESPAAIHWERQDGRGAYTGSRRCARPIGGPPCGTHWGSFLAVRCDSAVRLSFPLYVVSLLVSEKSTAALRTSCGKNAQFSLISGLTFATHNRRRFRHRAIRVHLRAGAATGDSERPAQDSARSPNTPLCWRIPPRDSTRSGPHPCDSYSWL